MLHISKKIPVLILCGGKGSRLGDVGKKIPKSLLLINKKPILEYIIENLIKNDFDEIHISGYYKISKLYNYIKKYKNKNIKCHNDGDISIIQRIKKNLRKINSDLLVCYGDEIANVNYKKLIKIHYENNKQVTLTTLKIKSNFGFLKKNKNKYEFIEKPELGNCNIGFMIFNYKNHSKIGNLKSLPNYLNKLCKKNLIYEYLHTDKHITVNNIEDLAKAKKEIKKI